VGRLDGVGSVAFDIERHSVAVAYEDARVDLGSITAAIEDAGYEVPGDTA